MDKECLYYILITAILVYIIVKMLYKPTVIELKEDFTSNNNLPNCGSLPLYTPNSSACGDGPINVSQCPLDGFYLKGNRYADKSICPCSHRSSKDCKCPHNCLKCNCNNGAATINNKQCPCGCENGCSCQFNCQNCGCKDMRTDVTANTGIDWSVKHNVGSNCTCGDKSWHCMSPRMILQDNSMRCNEYTYNNTYNPPNGILNNLASKHDVGRKFNEKKVHGLIYDELGIPNFSNDCTGYLHTMSQPRNNGIVPMHKDCVNKKISKNI